MSDSHQEKWSELDERMMRRALALAECGAGHVAPNPMVGAVIVKDDVIVGEGFHASYGEAHAEAAAIAAAGTRAKGGTLYVTLEPCNHHGKTPPCSEAILQAGISRVVYSVGDPNRDARGGGLRLREAGIEVSSGLLGTDARELNAPFFHSLTDSTRPWVTLKLGVSIDGAIAGAARRRSWLTGAEARRYVHRLRALADAIAVGAGTALTDDPELTVRGDITPRVLPRRVVFDRKATLPLDSYLVRTAREIPVFVATDGSAPANESALEALGVTILHAHQPEDAFRKLRALGVRHLLAEGGAGLSSELMAHGLVDRLIIFQAPVILGKGALSAFSSLPVSSTEDAPRLRVVERRTFGEDLMTVYAVSRE